MREFKLDYSFRPEARRTYDTLSGLHQADIDRRIDLLCEQPDPDDEITFAWPEEGPNVFIFYDEAWLFIYALVDEGRVIEIWTIIPAGRLRSGA